MSAFERSWRTYSDRVESELDRRLPSATKTPQQLHQAMRYASLDGGKRFRAMLVYAVGQYFGGTVTQLDGIAVAIELVHAYSLVHDDLPAMDDDDLRRGRLSCHKAYDEATAILAGDAIQSLAFEVLAQDPDISISDARRLRMIQQLAAAIGASGMAGGQALDMEATGQRISAQALATLHEMKTGALIRASCVLGGLAIDSVSEQQLQLLDRYGDLLGLSFQVRDDILDVTQNSEVLGKSSGSDVTQEKTTYVTVHGIETAERICSDLRRQAVETASRLGDNTEVFMQLADFVVSRRY